MAHRVDRRCDQPVWQHANLAHRQPTRTPKALPRTAQLEGTSDCRPWHADCLVLWGTYSRFKEHAMRTLLFVAALFVAAAAQTTTSVAQEAPIPPSAASQAAEQPRPGNEPWRFKNYNGRWWYYTTNNQWMFHDGATWRPYQPGVAFAPKRPFTYDRSSRARINR
jgi:hypothetical protein